MAEKILHIEACSGVSGDMLLGAFIDSGVPVEVLAQAWDQLKLDNYEVEVFKAYKSGIRALQCRVRTVEEKGPRSWKEYQGLLKRSKLPPILKNRTLKLVRQLFEIEGQLHGAKLDQLHLHEMGGTDLLLDVTGCLAALDYCKPDVVSCSPVNTGRGFVRFSHGNFPLPAPATTKLLEGIPVFQNEVEGELTTPTGALLIRSIAQKFGAMPSMTLLTTGTGAGEKEIEGHPNVLRMFVGTNKTSENEDIFLVETNLDDSSPQVLAYFMEKAFEEGALDVFFTPIFMKKNRPAVRLSLLIPGALMDSLLELLFAETTAIGLRYWKVGRKTLDRKWTTVQVAKQKIRIKESYLNGELANYQAEFDDCKKAALNLKRPLKTVMSQAIHQYLAKKSR